ncbi:MAG: hypothetical protein KBC11_00985 [Candidatus Pacebacteria bacterium]|nr:hypothetical protein [Candidatus Paceibacterota bacterium]
MKSIFKKYGTSIIIAIVGTAILVSVWVINGSEKEDLWLYIFSIWLILYSAYTACPKTKKNKD